jgi:hypothetical protein
MFKLGHGMEMQGGTVTEIGTSCIWHPRVKIEFVTHSDTCRFLVGTSTFLSPFLSLYVRMHLLVYIYAICFTSICTTNIYRNMH